MIPSFRLLAAGALAAALCALTLSATTAERAKVQPDSALQLLLVGNKNFAAGRAIRPDQSVERRLELAGGQHPFAIVLTCADSRVSPEIYFDQGLGDIFVLRNAGNVLDDHVIGSIEYAVEHLGATLIVVVGHSKCGAVAATVAGGHAPGHLPSIVHSIQPAVEKTAGQAGDKVDLAVRMNAQLVAAELAQCGPLLNEAVAKGALKVVAARYDLATGKVEILPPHGAAPETQTAGKKSTHAQAASKVAAAEKPAAHGH